MTANQQRLWKLSYIVFPALITGGFSYLKAKTEAKEQSRAAYDTVKKAVDELQENLKEANGRADKLALEVDDQGAWIKKFEAKQLAAGVRPSPPPTVGVGMGAGALGHGHDEHKAPEPAPLPAKFEDMVEQYKKAKK